MTKAPFQQPPELACDLTQEYVTVIEALST